LENNITTTHSSSKSNRKEFFSFSPSLELRAQMIPAMIATAIIVINKFISSVSYAHYFPEVSGY